MAGAATDGDVLGARGSSANGPMAGSDGLTVYASTRVKARVVPFALRCLIPYLSPKSV